MRHYLVVAHQTLGAPELMTAMRDRLAEGACTFHLVVPEYHGGAGLTWTEGQVRAEAKRRLEEARLHFVAEGLPVTGEVGDASPVDAVTDVRSRVDWVSAAAGGRGAVREFIELVLRARGSWDEVLATYLNEGHPVVDR